MKVVFLHIPKTAGQSVHAALVDSFTKEKVMPARVNNQLLQYSIKDINRYDVFSGHFDWSALDCVEGEKYTFTILRDPIERILSFYFYLRDKSLKMPENELDLPGNFGLKAAKNYSPNDYFTAGPGHFRNFIDDHYDNFYSYYFAGRTYNSRSNFKPLLNSSVLQKTDIVDLALENISIIDDVFMMNQMPEVFTKVSSFSDKSGKAKEFNVNVNKDSSGNRLELLKSMDKSELAVERIMEWVDLDNLIIKEIG